MKPSPGSLYRRRLGRILKMHREDQDITRKKVQSKILQLLEEHKGQAAWDQFRNLVDPDLGGLIEIEERGMTNEKVYLPDIQLLATAYGIPELMLDPARSLPLKGLISVGCADDFLEVSQEGVPFYGHKAKYSVPKSQLEGTENVAIVQLKFEEEPSQRQKRSLPAHSDSHIHPGEEILYVERGEIEMRFEDTGLRSRLEAGSLIHFDARSKHSAWNLSPQGAQCFIIRFYRPETRATETVALAGTKALSKTATTLGEEVLDGGGFGRFLQLMCSVRFRGQTAGRLSLSDLAKRTASFSRSKLDRIHRGEAQVLKRELRELAAIYEIEPMVLYNFLLPNFHTAIAVHGEEDMVKIREDFLPKGVAYRLPRRRLASSDMTIALLTLDRSSAATNPNHHPGQELIKPLKGKVAIEFEGLSATVEEGQYAHYYSHLNHRAVNKGTESATVLSIRFIC